ncbi:MAG: TonB-dependent receptor [Bacteroidota bacterium]
MKSILNLATLLAFLIPCSIMAQNAYITGQVTDAQGPLPNATILIEGKSSSVVYTDIDGSFRIEVAPGRYKVILNEIGYNKITQGVNVKDRETISLDLNLSLAINQLVQSATLIEQDVEDAPATIHVFSAEEIRERGYRSLNDLLGDVPEIEIQENTAATERNLIGLRGVTGNEKFLIFMDDIRVSSATGELHTIAENYPLANVKRVEVLMGPASAVFGSDAYSGVINIITFDGTENTGINVTGSYGNFNTTDNNVIVGFKKNDFSGSITGTYYQTNGANYNELYPQDYAWYNEEFAPNGTLKASLFNQDFIQLSDADREFYLGNRAYSLNGRFKFDNFEVGFFHNSEIHSSALATLPNSTTFSRDNKFQFNLSSIYAQHKYTSQDGNLKLHTLFSSNITSISPQSSYQGIRTSYERSYIYEHALSNRLQERLSYRLSDNLDLVAGLTFEDAEALPTTSDLPQPFNAKIPADLQDLPYFGTDVITKDGEDLSIQQDFFNIQYFNLGTFAQTLYRPTDWLQLTLGARYDYNTRFGGNINPRAGILVKPNDNLRIKLLYGESFLSPSPGKSFSQFGRFLYDPTNEENNQNSPANGLFAPFFLLPNADLEPEELSSYEASVSWRMSDLLTFSVNGFYTKTTNTINAFGVDNTRFTFKQADVAYVLTPTNIGETTILGGTIGVRGKQELGSQMQIKYFAYYTYMDGEVNQIQQLPFVAEQTFKGGLTFKYGKLAFTPRLLYKSASLPATEDASIIDVSGTEYYLLNAYAMYDVIDNANALLSVFIEGSNLLNTRFYNLGSTSLAAMPFTPQAPLQINFGASLRLK